MPERIFAIFADIPAERERVRRMCRDAGLFEQLAKPPAASGLLHKIALPNEEVARRLAVAAAANGLEPPSIHRYMDPTPKELAAAPLLLLRPGGPGTDRALPCPGPVVGGLPPGDS